MSTSELDDLERTLYGFNNRTTLDELYSFVESVRSAHSSTTSSDRKRVELQVEALRLVWMRDGLTGKIMRGIIFNDDASLAQKARAFRIWIGASSA